jgi:hypothetical protein
VAPRRRQTRFEKWKEARDVEERIQDRWADVHNKHPEWCVGVEELFPDGGLPRQWWRELI